MVIYSINQQGCNKPLLHWAKIDSPELDEKIQPNLVVTNSTGPWKYVRYNRERFCSEMTIWDQKSGVNFFVMNVIVIIEFDCTVEATYCDQFGPDQKWQH